MAGIYVHIPFCRSKCAYCDFYSVADHRSREAVTAAILAEHAARLGELDGEPVKTLYIGGGTPSVLSDDDIARLASGMLCDTVEEFTIEVNPEDVEPGRVSRWREAGINRVSMGVQSLSDAELKAVGRRHDAATALRAIATLRAGGIANISCDLIYGLPGQSPESWRRSLDVLLATGICHLSAYSLSYEEGTLLYRRLAEGLVTEAGEDEVVEMYGYLCEAARAAGFEHYEISNFARPGFRSRHNSAYWDGTPYLGLGPGAHSYTRGVRKEVPRGIKEYLAWPAGTRLTSEIESREDRLNDILVTALRTSDGLPPRLLGEDGSRDFLTRARRHIECGNLEWAERDSEAVLRIPEERWLVADATLRDLLFD